MSASASHLKILCGLPAPFLVVMLSACGGGGGPQVSASVPSARVFQLNVAQLAVSSTAISSAIKVSGTVNNATVIGSGTATESAVQASVFEGKAALQKTSTLSMSRLVDGKTSPLILTITSYFDSNYLPLGTSGIEYRVVMDQRSLPSTAKVGEGDTAYIANRYASISKADFLGTVESTWALLSDTDTTAILKITEITKDLNGDMTAQSVASYRITPFGGVTRIGKSTMDSVSHTNLVVTY
jgi:hypothetical protein